MLDQDVTCTCPPEIEHVGPGVPVKLSSKSHRRGCPVVKPIFEMMNRVAKEHAETHDQGGGILPSPGEVEARRVGEEVAELRRRVEKLEAERDSDGDT